MYLPGTFHRLLCPGHSPYPAGCMEKQSREIASRFVRRVMPNATESEIEEATQRWFGFLQTLDRIVRRREPGARDSSYSPENDRFPDMPDDP
jgi:hypothetical protein